MTPEQRRAHLVLQRQTLLDAWLVRCGAIRAANASTSHTIWKEDVMKAAKAWAAAVHAEFGMECTMHWSEDSLRSPCTLSNGEVYTWPYKQM